jgi:hypothetical protein
MDPNISTINLSENQINKNLSSRDKLKKMTIFLIIILLFIIAGTFYFKIKSDKSTLKNKQMEAESANWSNYTNKTCKYSVKFPIDWERVNDPFNGEESINFKPVNTNLIGSSDMTINISANLLKEMPGFNLKNEIDNNNKFLWKNWTNKKIENINFAGVDAIKVTGENYGVSHIEILLLTNNCYFKLEGVGSYIPVFNKILPTFQLN